MCTSCTTKMEILTSHCIRTSTAKLSSFTIFFAFLLSCSFFFSTAEAYGARGSNGNITIKWDVINWTPDGYIAVVDIFNYQKHRNIEAPGWTLGWTWARNEVIWEMIGAQTTEQGDCSRFKGNVPHSCKRNPTVVDLLPGTPYSKQIANCCRGGVLHANAVSAFQVSVGQAGTSAKTVKLPRNFTLKGSACGYTCGLAKIAKPTVFRTSDKRRFTHAFKTWKVVCTYSQFLCRKI